MPEQPDDPRDDLARAFVGITERIASEERFDRGIAPMERLARRLDTSPAGAWLRGDWLGHALHPVLTDLPIGCWTSSFLLDVIGGRAARPASRRLIGLGVLSAVPTVAAGLVDWRQLREPGRRRIGVVHAASNVAATVCYAASWKARRRGLQARGVALGIVAAAVATAGGFLGGHLAFGADDDPGVSADA